MVTVSASTKIHAFALAEQLEKQGLLDMLITSYAYSRNTIARRFIRRIDKEQIPVHKIKTNLLIAIPIGFFLKYTHIWNDFFDRWVARNLKKSKSRIFIGWSGMSLHSIRQAKKIGMKTILERGSSHILVQNQILKEEYKNFGREFSIHPAVVNKELQEYEEADYISVPSFFVKESFIMQGVPEGKIIVNPYGASRAFIRKAQVLNGGNSRFRIVYLGTISIRKGLLYFFKALQDIRIPEEDFEVLIIGSVEKEMEETLLKYRRPNWRVLGHVNHYDLPEHLNGCDIAVQPSLEEGLSMVIPQLMASGIPVIITPNTGGENIIRNNINGFVVPIRNPVAISEKVKWAFEHPDLLFEMKIKAADSIKEGFTWDDYGNRYADFLRTISNKTFSGN